MTVLASGLLGHLLGMAFVPHLVGVAMDSELTALSAANGRPEFERLWWGAFGVQSASSAVPTSPDQRFIWL